jgi:hypothetical protein
MKEIHTNARGLPKGSFCFRRLKQELELQATRGRGDHCRKLAVSCDSDGRSGWTFNPLKRTRSVNYKCSCRAVKGETSRGL